MFSPERDVVRSKGLHLSKIIDYIEFLEGKREMRPDGPMSVEGDAFATSGFLWETVLSNLIERSPTELWEWLYSRALSEVPNPLVVRPGEQCLDGGICPVCDGKGSTYDSLKDPVEICDTCKGTGRVMIFMTPDGLNIETGRLEEYKWTTKGCKYVDLLGPKFKRWTLYQIPCYLKALNLNVCDLHVFFVRGDYTDNVPQWRRYTLSFSNQEIDEIWDSIVQHAQLLLKGNSDE